MALTNDQTRTLLLASLEGQEPARKQLSGEVYAALRDLALRYMGRERREHTLQATALIHEAYLRMADHPQLDEASRTRFMVIAAGEMRRVLVDHARGRDARKRGGDWSRVTLAGVPVGPDDVCGAVALAEALEMLGELSDRQLRVVELRFFAGFSMPEIAAVLGRSLATVEDDWYAARAWLRRTLSPDPGEDRS
ncbi:MAG: ECF-type sigma factor [Phycisphaerales bacterium]